MRLGPIQKDVMAYLARNDGKAYIGALTRAVEFRGYDREQVDLSVARLIERKIVYRRGVYVIIKGEQ